MMMRRLLAALLLLVQVGVGSSRQQEAVDRFRLYVRPLRKSITPGTVFEVEGSILNNNAHEYPANEGEDEEESGTADDYDDNLEVEDEDQYEVAVDEQSLPAFFWVDEIQYNADRSFAALETGFKIVLRIDDSDEARDAEAAVRDQHQEPPYIALSLLNTRSKQQVSREATVFLPFGTDLDEIVIVSINDWHAHIVPSQYDSRLRGAGSMTIRLDWLRSNFPDLILATSGDSIGASQAESCLDSDTPAYQVLDKWGVDVHAIGNHEFQHGWDHLLDPATNSLCNNVVNSSTQEPILPSFRVLPVARGDKLYNVCFTAAVTEEFTDIVRASNRDNVAVLPAAQTTEKVVMQLKRQHACHSVVVIIHQGGWGDDPQKFIRDNPTHEFTRFLQALDPSVDLVLSAHTHQSYVWKVFGHTVIQTDGFGISLASCTLQFDHASQELLSTECEVIPAYTPYLHDPEDGLWYMNNLAVPELSIPTRARAVGNIVSSAWRKRESKLPRKALGKIQESWTRPLGDEETVLGAHIADAMLQAGESWRQTFAPTAYQNIPMVALINDGGIREDWLTSNDRHTRLTNIDVWNSIPFFDELVVLPTTTSHLLDVLEEQFSHSRYAGRSAQFQVSGFTYRYDPGRKQNTNASILRNSLEYRSDSAGDLSEEGAEGGRRAEGKGRTASESDKVLMILPDYLVQGGDGYESFADVLTTLEVGVPLPLGVSLFDAVVNHTLALSAANDEIIPKPTLERAIDVSALLRDGQVVIVSQPHQVVVGPPGRVATVVYNIEVVQAVTVRGPFTVTVAHMSNSNNLLDLAEYSLERTDLNGPVTHSIRHTFTVTSKSRYLEMKFQSKLFDGNPFFPDGLVKHLDIAPHSGSLPLRHFLSCTVLLLVLATFAL